MICIYHGNHQKVRELEYLEHFEASWFLVYLNLHRALTHSFVGRNQDVQFL